PRAAPKESASAIVHTIHGLAFDASRSPAANALYRWAERRAARRSHRLIAVCERMADRAAAARLAPRDRIDVVYSGMDTARFRAAAGERDAVRRAWGVREDAFVFLKLARLFPMKGHRFVLPAFAEVARRHRRAVLVLAGEGVLRRRLEGEAARLGVADRVRFLGLVPREDVPALLWAADAVVHAGLREGLARVLPQAGLCRRPVVTFDVGGAAEVVRDGENGYLLPPPPPGPWKAHWRGGSPYPPRRDRGRGGSAAGTETRRAGNSQARRACDSIRVLAEAMAALASDPPAARAMGEAWRAEVLDRFDYRRATREIMQVYTRAGRV
ncbi:MAG: glycosyltransferase family 4 protein, partial [Phycisphaerae bacterium]